MLIKPLCIDLFCGLGGWTDGFLAEGWEVIGFDIERHIYGEAQYPAQLVLQDVLSMRGEQFKTADIIVASPPCQFFSYVAMPWSRAKALAVSVRADPVRLKRELALFDACFRIQREASEAAGRHIPMVVENVKGAQPWVGRAHWHYGSFFLWGDIPALMPIQRYHQRWKVKAGEQWNVNRQNFTGTRGWDEHTKNNGGSWFAIGSPGQKELSRNQVHALMVREPVCDSGHPESSHDIGSDAPFSECSCINPVYGDGIKMRGRVNKRDGHSHTRHLTNPAEHDGVKQGGDWFNSTQPSISRMTSSKSPARKAASALIAKIPLQLSAYIARSWYPR